MDFLKGFTDAFERIREKPLVLVPVAGVLLITVIFNLALYAIRDNLGLGNIFTFSMSAFIFAVIEWALAILAVGITTSLMMEDKQFGKEDAKKFLDLFIFSVFMAFFLMVGFSINVILGLIVLLLILYIPDWFVSSNTCAFYSGFKWNISFIFKGTRSAYAFILVIGTALLTLIPYGGTYLSILFYVIWTANTYVHMMIGEVEK